MVKTRELINEQIRQIVILRVEDIPVSQRAGWYRISTETVYRIDKGYRDSGIADKLKRIGIHKKTPGKEITPLKR